MYNADVELETLWHFLFKFLRGECKDGDRPIQPSSRALVIPMKKTS